MYSAAANPMYFRDGRMVAVRIRRTEAPVPHQKLEFPQLELPLSAGDLSPRSGSFAR